MTHPIFYMVYITELETSIKMITTSYKQGSIYIIKMSGFEEKCSEALK